MSPSHFSRPPKALRKARLDNIAIVPASLLPYKAQYQAIANRLPTGGILVVLPQTTSQQRRTAQRVITTLQGGGYSVATARLEQFCSFNEDR
jgi:hypothetical protein